MTSLARELSDLEAALGALLSALEGPPTADTSLLETACTHVASVFARVQRASERVPGERAACEERLARCLRLYAVAAGMLEALRGAFAREREVCTQARARLGRLHADAASGASCDLSA